jgi:hypothetical protein
MYTLRSQRPATLSRVFEVVLIAATVLAAAWGGAWLSHWDRRPPETSPTAQAAPARAQVYDTSTGFPRLKRPAQRDPREPEPRAVEARAAVRRRDAAAIEAQCQKAAGGDWDKWQKDTEPYRAALKSRIDALRVFPERANDAVECRYEALAGRDDFPLFEVGPHYYLPYLFDPAVVEPFRHGRPVVAASRWLGQQGIDLIFVPAPRMTEVYVEHFLDPCPPDGVVAPHLRQTLLELLKEDVEVVDGFSLFRAVRNADEEYLYNAGTPHWAPRAMRVMAKEIADRIERYKFGARARYALPVCKTSPGPFLSQGHLGGIGDVGYLSLTAEQSARATAAQTTNESHVTLLDDRVPPNNPDSPVVVIGNCWVEGFWDQLVKELNLQISTFHGPGHTTEEFVDFLRDPTRLRLCRVVVWITSEQYMTTFKPLPPPILKTLRPHK